MWVADYDLVILTPTTSVFVNVSLMRAPPGSGAVVVTIDSSAGAGLFLVSQCTLTFNSSNWAIPQSVFFAPMITNVADKSPRVCSPLTFSVQSVQKMLDNLVSRV